MTGVDDYYTVSEAATLLKVSHPTVWRWIKSGKLKAQRVGPKTIRIRKDDLVTLLSPVPVRTDGGQLRLPASHNQDFLPGGGEMGALVRAHDWTAVPLGPIEGWPQSLRTAVDLCLGSALPSFVWWGPDLIQFYNDAARAVLRAKHPAALGVPARETWADVWQDVGALLEDVLRTGEAIRGDDMPMVPDRGGPAQTAWFTFSYGPVHDESGAVGGVFCSTIETTDRVRAAAALRAGEERQAFLLKLSDDLRVQPDETAIGALCTRRLAEHLQLDRCYFARFYPEEDRAFVGPEYHRPDLRPVTGDYRLSDFPEAVRRIQTQTLVFDDVAGDPDLTESDKAALAVIDFGAYVAAGVRKGDEQVLWVLAAASTAPRAWKRPELVLVEDVAERAWAAIEHARAEAALLAARDEAEQWRRLYETVTESTPDLIYIIDLDYKLTYANEAVLTVWGTTWDQAVGKRLLELSYEPRPVERYERDIDQVVTTKQPIRGEMQINHYRLGRRIYDYIFAPIVNAQGDAVAIAGTARDITELRQLAQQKEALLGIAAHELRTPLTTIKAYSQLLDRKGHSPTQTSRLLTEVERLEWLINELLDTSRLQQGRLELHREPIDLAELAREVVGRFGETEEQTQGHQVVVEASQPVLGRWDAGRLDQVVTNLLSNAIKYSPEGSKVRVAVSQQNEQAILTVSDQGIGMSHEEQARLFTPFARGEQARTVAGGMGLGLYIVSELVKRHGGTITVESERGAGSTFTVQLPCAPQPADPATASSG